ncbi:MAG TPA: ribokinase [Chloroflexi bacterium]|nr:ribokinase [Chloroflexota bacterium]|tara:strand:+ start:13265 stop:14164 length:900 start_codon:yes stop_codon:yes gene_type:complete
MNSIAVVGSINLDIVIRVPRIPQVGETIHHGTIAHHPGGKGANQAVAASLAGAEVSMIGSVGMDTAGSELLASLKAHNVDTRYVSRITSTHTGTAVITVDTNGSNSIALAEGANAAIEPGNVADAVAQLAPQAILCQREIPDSVIATAFSRRNSAALHVLNVSPVEQISNIAMDDIDLLVVNQIEAKQLIGTQAGAMDAATTLAQRTRRGCIVTLGAKGLVAQIDGHKIKQPAYSVKVVDTTGAGDAFCGAFVTELLETQNPEHALRFGQAAGAVAVTRHGAQPSMPDSPTIRALMQTA